jgi:thioesterase-3
METFFYPAVIKEIYLDSFGHMNNAAYLTLLEDARWEIIYARGFGVKEIMEKHQGPVVLEINIRFEKELRVRDKVVIETACAAYEGKIARLSQIIKRGDERCCAAVVTMGLFDLKDRRLIAPTPEWLSAIGLAASA